MLSVQGIVPPLVTPFDGDGNVDTRALNQLVEYQIAAGVHGLFVLGSSGEVASLDNDERATVVRTVVNATHGRVPVLVGVTDTALHRIYASVGMAHELGADAVVVPPTYYYWSNQRELLELFRAIHAKSTLPVIAYNVPVLVKVALEADTLVELARDGVICAIKDSSADLSISREMLMRLREVPGVAVLTGQEFVADLAIAMGMHGAVPGLANVAPRAYVDIYDLVGRGEFEQARRIQETMIELFRITRQGHSGQSHSAGALSGFKAGLKHLGVIATSRMHAPMQGLTAAEEESVKAILQETALL